MKQIFSAVVFSKCESLNRQHVQRPRCFDPSILYCFSAKELPEAGRPADPVDFLGNVGLHWVHRVHPETSGKPEMANREDLWHQTEDVAVDMKLMAGRQRRSLLEAPVSHGFRMCFFVARAPLVWRLRLANCGREHGQSGTMWYCT